ncbi:MAG: protein kinase [Bacteroidales bacterium]|nr:protein kinase [Bacteroidales bacterium]
MNNDLSNLPAGKSLQNGKYKIIKVLGQGGFGITYLAEQTGLGMKVAIKEFFLKGSCQRDSTTSNVSIPVSDNEELVSKCLKKFKSEARKIASLNNDHIVNIIDIFDENGTSYYVMKHLDGGCLADRIKNKAISEDEAVKIIKEIADALRSVHSHGLLHLDIKPANILFDERGRAVLIDFGVSKYVDSQQDTTTTSTLVGFSRGFAPLEQVNATASSLTPATDLYALGATLYNLVMGITPPEASLIMDSGFPEMPATISEEVKQTILKAMQPRRKDRPQNVEAFVELLPKESPEPAEDEATIVIAPKPQTTNSRTRNGKYALIISSALLISSLILFGATILNNKKVENPQPIVDTSQIDALNNQVQTLTRTNTSLQRQLEELKTQNNTLSTENSTLRKNNTTLQNQVNSYKPDAERWRRQLELNN